MEEFQHPRPRQQGAGTKIAVIVLAVFVLVFLGYLLYSMIDGKSSFSSGSSENSYQAVFLTNGQVYFSKVEEEKSDFITLSDIYYLRVQQNLQPATNNNGDQPSISLVKLGNELHGPEDVMYVNMEHVLFIEPLKTESNVVQAIRKDKAGLN